VTAFIRKGPMETHVKPPEASAVLVIGGGIDLPNNGGHAILLNWLVNRDGLDYFSDYTADPTNPDWIGELVPLLYVDTTLNTQDAVDFMAWRLFHVTCHGIKMTEIEAPLVLVTDPNDTNQTKPRPPRFYDPVLVNDDGTESQWLVRNCNPFWRKDGFQWASYELEAPRAPYA